MQHPKTTIAGICMIIAGIAQAAVSFFTGGAVDPISVFSTISGGVGLIKAADAAKKPEAGK